MTRSATRRLRAYAPLPLPAAPIPPSPHAAASLRAANNAWRARAAPARMPPVARACNARTRCCARLFLRARSRRRTAAHAARARTRRPYHAHARCRCRAASRTAHALYRTLAAAPLPRCALALALDSQLQIRLPRDAVVHLKSEQFWMRQSVRGGWLSFRSMALHTAPLAA